MNHGLSKAMLSTVLDNVVEYSRRLDPLDYQPEHRVERQHIAFAVNHAKGTKKMGAAKKWLSALENPNAVGKGANKRPPQPINHKHLHDILSALRQLLCDQFHSLGHRTDGPNPRLFESQLCRKLGVPRDQLDPSDFDDERLLHSACTPEQLGFPNMFVPSAIEPVDLDIRACQRKGLALLSTIRTSIQLASGEAARLSLLHIALNAALMHHPGEPTHHHAVKLAHDAADAAGLFGLRRHSDGQIRSKAELMVGQLSWLSFEPLLHSPTNYLPAILCGHRLRHDVWRDVRLSLDQAILATRMRRQINPTEAVVGEKMVSVLTLKARLLLAAGGEAEEVEADALYRESLQIAEQRGHPYAQLYPVLRSVRQGQPKAALKTCETLITQFQRSGDLRAASAYAGLFLQISANESGFPTTDSTIVSLAQLAISTPGMDLAYSHVFDSKAVGGLLPRPRRSRSRYRA